VRIALVSDTHLPRFGRSLPAALVEGIRERGVGRILHAGDWTEPIAVDLLEALAPVDGVAGNNDGPELHARFGTKRVLEIGGARFGLTHGHLGTGPTTPERAIRSFADEQPRLDAIVFGHSHIPLIREPAGSTAFWLLNPGSPTDRRHQPRFSWLCVTVDEGQIKDVELVTYADRSIAPETAS
jgi:putative phosphoesterase